MRPQRQALVAPSQIAPRLADQGQDIASESSFYRVLMAANQRQQRGTGRPQRKRSMPRALCATVPKQIFNWDITYLPKLVIGVYFYLYLFMTIFSWKIVGWQIYEAESSELARQVMHDICQRENIAPQQVVLHTDNGSAMKSATMLATLQALGDDALVQLPGGHGFTGKPCGRVRGGKSKAPSAREWPHAQLAAGAGDSSQS